MGVNMRILHCYGVKQKEIKLPENDNTIYTDNFCDMFYNSSELKQNDKPVIFDDCYGSTWEFFGQIIHSSHDFRYEGWDSFEWEVDDLDVNTDIDELCNKYGLPKPKHYIITYYS